MAARSRLGRRPARSKSQQQSNADGHAKDDELGAKGPNFGIVSECATGDVPTTAMIRTRDKFGNACVSGGLRMQGRLQLVKQSSNDITILTPNNHTVDIEDNEDGTYLVKVTVVMACIVKLIVKLCRGR